jgi:hypothetical protein
VALAQEQEKPAIAPIPRTINLTQEQRFIIKENLKDLHLPKCARNNWRRSASGHRASLAADRSNKKGAASTISFVFR